MDMIPSISSNKFDNIKVETALVGSGDLEDSYDALNQLLSMKHDAESYNMLFTFTDGLYRNSKLDDKHKAILSSADKVFNARYAFGYGSSVSEYELSEWSSAREDECINYFLVDKVQDLDEELENVIIKLINNPVLDQC